MKKQTGKTQSRLKRSKMYKIKAFLSSLIIFTVLICSIGRNLFPSAIQAAVLPGGFAIDTEYIYPNMDTAYKDGYNPRISGGKAMIVMPLIHEGYDIIADDQITATVQYGNVAETPFVIKQYQKQVKPDIYNLADGQIKQAYLVEFDLDLKSGRVNGTYPVNIAIHYSSYDIDDNGNSIYTDKEQVFPAYVVIQDGIDPGDGTTDPKDVNLNLESCTIDPQVINPGDTFLVSTRFKNTSAGKDIKNIKISYDNAEGVLIPADSVGSKRLDSLKAGASDTIGISMKAADTITNYQQKLVLNIEYQDIDGNSYTETENIYIALQPPPEDNTTPVSNVLEIETKHTFRGMASSYEKGYVPSISKDKATIIMPLVFKGGGQIKGNEITSIAGFDGTANQAFQIKSYDKKFKLYPYTSKEGDKLPVYLVKFTLDLKKDRINGVYPINITVRYELENEAKEQVFTAYVVIEDGTDPGEGQSSEEPVQFTPKLIVKDCRTEPADINTGEEVTFLVTLKNTNKDKKVRDLKITYLSDTGDLIPAGNKNSIFVESLGAGKTKDITFKMKVGGDVTASNQTINLTMEGVDDKAAPVSSTDSLFIHVNQPFGIRLENPVIREEVKSGKTEKIKIPVFNTGKTDIKNIICTLKLPGLLPSGTAYIGELKPSATEEAAISAVVANKKITDSSVAEEDKYGLVKGTVTVDYEDAEGKTYTRVLDIQTKIVPPENETKDAAVISSQWWISFIAGLIVIQFIIYGILFYRKKRMVH